MTSTSSVPQTLLRLSQCPVCGRPAREIAPCPWCGERCPASRKTWTDALLLLLAWSSLLLTPTGFFACFLAGVLLTFRLCGRDERRSPSARARRSARAVASYLLAPFEGVHSPGRRSRDKDRAALREARKRRMAEGLLSAGAGVRIGMPSLTAALVALAAGRFPVSAAAFRSMAVALPVLLAAAVCLFRAPAEPPVPGGMVRTRLLACGLPGLFLFCLVLPPVLFPSSVLAPAVALGVLLSRLVFPLPWLLFASFSLAAALPDASAFALGTVLGTVLAECVPHFGRLNFLFRSGRIVASEPLSSLP